MERPGRVQAGQARSAGVETAERQEGDRSGLGRKGASIDLGPAACQGSRWAQVFDSSFRLFYSLLHFLTPRIRLCS